MGRVALIPRIRRRLRVRSLGWWITIERIIRIGEARRDGLRLDGRGRRLVWKRRYGRRGRARLDRRAVGGYGEALRALLWTSESVGSALKLKSESPHVKAKAVRRANLQASPFQNAELHRCSKPRLTWLHVSSAFQRRRRFVRQTRRLRAFLLGERTRRAVRQACSGYNDDIVVHHTTHLAHWWNIEARRVGEAQAVQLALQIDGRHCDRWVASSRLVWCSEAVNRDGLERRRATRRSCSEVE